MTVESNFILPHIPDDKLASVRAAVKVWCVLCCKKKNKTKKKQARQRARCCQGVVCAMLQRKTKKR
jgi:hypothetical protein